MKIIQLKIPETGNTEIALTIAVKETGEIQVTMPKNIDDAGRRRLIKAIRLMQLEVLKSAG